MMGEYELVVVTPGSEGSSSHKEQKGEVKKIIESEKGEILDIEEWGKKDLAYPIKRQSTGYYSLISFRGDSKSPNNINAKLRLKENFLRYMIVKKEAGKRVKEKQGKAENFNND